jgi:phosphatidylinositol N-acetylglucosaminyltransferase subunit P
MPPQSRGNGPPQPPKPPPTPTGFQSHSTPNLPTLRTYERSDSHESDATYRNTSPLPSPEIITSPSEPASIDDFSLDPESLSPTSTDENASEDASEDDDVKNGSASKLPPRTIYHHQSRSHGHLAPQAFAPPFYGRPPTPLPPSPSLTSLLRPHFSSQFNSRPTTPDPSSDEGTPNTRGDATGAQTPNSAAASTLTSTLRTAKPIPRASPKVPTYEYYGFTLYLTSSLAFIVYLLWSFLPSPFLHQLGIYYYPNRWWALAIPAWTVMLVLYIYVALASYNTGYLTLPMNSVECLVDEAANVAVIDANGRLIYGGHSSSSFRKSDEKHGNRKKGGKGKSGGRSRQSSVSMSQLAGLNQEVDWRGLWNEGTDAVMDIPTGGVCEILYGSHDGAMDDIIGHVDDR